MAEKTRNPARATGPNNNARPSSTPPDFYERVYEIVCRIPSGRVSTYGHIGQALGLKSSARMVGWAMNAVVDRMDIPCHRVVNRNGELTGKMHFATPTLMRELLEGEGVEFVGDAVNMKRHLWIPAEEDTPHEH